MTSSKALEESVSETARTFLRRILKRDFPPRRGARPAEHHGSAGIDVTSAAERLGVTQPGLSSFLNGTTGAGMKILLAIADLAECSIDEVIGRAPASPNMSALDIALAFAPDMFAPMAVALAREEMSKGVRMTPRQWANFMTDAQGRRV